MLLTVNEVDGLSDGMDELSDEELPGSVPTTNATANKQLLAHPYVVMVSGKAFFGHTKSPRNQHLTYCMAVCLSGQCLCLCVCVFECVASICPPFSVQTVASQNCKTGNPTVL